MTTRAYGATAFSAAAGALWALGIAAAAFRLPNALAGPELAALAGARPDPHLITAAVWHAMVSASGYSVLFVHAANVLAMIAFTACVGIAAWLISRNIPLATFSAAFLSCAPFARSIMVDPVGAEAMLGLMLMVVAVTDLNGRLRIPELVRLALAPLIALQSPELAASAGLYALVMPVRARIGRAGSVAAFAGIAFLRFGAHVSWLQQLSLAAPESASFRLTMLALAVACVAMPIALVVARRTAKSRGARFVSTSLMFFMGMSALAGGVFVYPDPSSAFFAAEACIVLALGTLTIGYLAKIAVITASLSLSALAWAPAEAFLPSQIFARQGVAVREALAEEPSGQVCVVGSDGAALLADGTLARLYGGKRLRSAKSASDCLSGAGGSASAIVAMSSRASTVWNRSTLPLGQAVLAAETRGARPLRFSKLPSTPETDGVFASMVKTPLGAAPALTITAGHEYAVRCLTVRRSSRLTFAAANPLSGLLHADPVRFVVSLNGRPRQSVTFLPRSGGGVPWKYYELDLHRSRCATLTVAVTAPTGHAVGTWVSIVAPSIAAPSGR